MKSPTRMIKELLSWSFSAKLWQKVYVDFAGLLNGEYYFVDAFSKCPEIIPTQTITSQQTINILQEIFVRSIWCS